MKIYSEISLENFEFWSGAKDTAAALSHSDFDTIETILEDLYPDGVDETTINDIFWFEEDTIAEWLGFRDWADFCGEYDDEEEEEEEEENDDDENE